MVMVVAVGAAASAAAAPSSQNAGIKGYDLSESPVTSCIILLFELHFKSYALHYLFLTYIALLFTIFQFSVRLNRLMLVCVGVYHRMSL